MKGEKGRRRRNELLKIAYRMFIEKGYNNTSVDEIIAEAGIAKGTYYYYFPSKESTLEAVIDMMINDEVGKAKDAVGSDLPVSQKLAAVIQSFRPKQEEENIADVLESKENLILHDKLNKRLIAEAEPLISAVVREGIAQGIFRCEMVEERVKMILILCIQVFNRDSFTKNDITVFIDIFEKTFGAETGTMNFITDLIR